MKGAVIKTALFLLFLLTIDIGAIDVADVKKFSEKYSQLFDSAGDVLADLKDLKMGVKALISMSGPVSSLVAAAIDAQFDPESEEQIAISKLHSSITHEFKEVKFTLARIESKVELVPIMTKYLMEVVGPLDSLVDLSQIVTKPKAHRSAHKKEFMDECKKSPHHILATMKSLFVTSCPMPNREEVLLTAKLINSLRLIETRIPGIAKYADYVVLKEDLMTAGRGGAQEEVINDIIESLGKISDSSEEQIERQFKEIQMKISRVLGPFDLCPMRIIYNMNHSRVDLDDLMTEVKTDIVKLSGAACACSNITSNGDKKLIDEYFEEIEDGISTVSDYIATWIEKHLSVVWPNIVLEKAKMAVPHPVDETKFLEYSQMIQDAANTASLAKYYHQVLLVPIDSYLDMAVIPATNPDVYATFVTDDFVCHIIRSEWDFNRQLSVRNFFSQNYEAMQSYVFYHAQLDISSTFPKMDEQFHLIGPETWKAGIQVRSKTIVCDHSQLKYCKYSGRNTSGYSAWNEIYARDNLGHCWLTRVYLMV